MRLIDADALLDKTVKKNRAWKSITNSEGKNLEEIVSEMPSVEQQERSEPFINKPCISQGVCHEDKVKVLDKVLDEVCDIDDRIILNPGSVFDRKAYVRLIKVMDTIEKYKAESEEK